MNTDISASYGFKMKSTGGKISADAEFGKDFSNGTSASNKMTNLEVSIKTIGGDPLQTNFSIPKDINNLNVDLSGWVNSLNDRSTLTMVNILDDGLYPLSDFIMEENLRNAFLKLYQTGVTEIKQLTEPYLLIESFVTIDQTLFAVHLMTRFGDIICLTSQQYLYISEEYFDNSIIEMTNKYKSIFGCKFVHEKTIQEPFYKEQRMAPAPLKDINENLQKFEYNNVIYLLSSTGYGYSIHNDYLLDTYAIRNFVNKLPSMQILPENLFDYKIIAL